MVYKPPIWKPGQTQGFSTPVIRVSGFEEHPVEARLLQLAVGPQIAHFIKKNRQAHNLGSVNFHAGRVDYPSVTMRYKISFGQEIIHLDFKPEAVKQILEEKPPEIPAEVLYARLRLANIDIGDERDDFFAVGHNRIGFRPYTHEGMYQSTGYFNHQGYVWSPPWAWPIADSGPYLYWNVAVSGATVADYMVSRGVWYQYQSAASQFYQMETWWNLTNIWKDFGRSPLILGFGSSPSFSSADGGRQRSMEARFELHRTPVPSAYQPGYETGGEFETGDNWYSNYENYEKDSRDNWCWVQFDNRYTQTLPSGVWGTTGWYGSTLNVPENPIKTLIVRFTQSPYTSGTVEPTTYHRLQVHPHTGQMLVVDD